MKQCTNAIGEAGIALELPIEGKIDFIWYKSILAKNITGVSVINFYPEISNTQIIGNVSLVVNYQTKGYYLEQICKICKKEEKLKDLKNELKDYYIEKKEAI